MQTGDTFDLVGAADCHRWVVITDTDVHPDCVVCVNFTSRDKYSDDACVLEPGDHPFIRHTTCIEYARAKQAPLSQWNQIEQAGRIRIYDPVTEQVLQAIRVGAARSTRIKNGVLEILQEQGIVGIVGHDEDESPF